MTTPEEFTQKQFDYIVIGGGLAGLVVATRLSEDENITVGVLEAGEDRIEDPLVKSFGLPPDLYENPKYDWGFKTVPQKFASNQTVSWPRGKMLGGSSASNFMAYVRPTKSDFANWVKLGNPGWDWDSLFPYFQKSEGFTPPSNDAEDNRWIKDTIGAHGTSGPVKTGFGETPVSMETWISTLENMGFDEDTTKSYGGDLRGSWVAARANDVANGTRSHSGHGYYAPNRGRKNLVVLTNAHVSKVVFEEGGKELVATGVEFIVGGKTYTAANVKREVIVSAGGVQSPQVLELSGIGGKKVLEQAGVKVLYENPNVGENLQDHAVSASAYEFADDPKLEKEVMATKMALVAGGGYVMGFQSYTKLQSADGLPAVSDLATPDKNPLLREENALQASLLESTEDSSIQHFVLPIHGNLSHSYNLVKELFTPMPGKETQMIPCFTIITGLSRPFSRGSIHITSSNPTDAPAIDPHYLERSIDKKILAGAIRHIGKLMQTKPLGPLVKQRLYPPPEVEKLEEYEDYVTKNIATMFHPIGTCSMLPQEKGGVVDSRLKVYGTKNLRVVDGSVFPLHVCGNMQSTVYAVAEKAADIFKEDQQ